MRRYELVVILNAHLNATDKERIIKGASDAVGKGGGKIINSQLWIEKQKFSFKIKQATEGTYYIINFEGDSACAVKIKQILRQNEEILRFAIFKIEKA